jgi:hypothetical protein
MLQRVFSGLLAGVVILAFSASEASACHKKRCAPSCQPAPTCAPVCEPCPPPPCPEPAPCDPCAKPRKHCGGGLKLFSCFKKKSRCEPAPCAAQVYVAVYAPAPVYAAPQAVYSAPQTPGKATPQTPGKSAPAPQG